MIKSVSKSIFALFMILAFAISFFFLVGCNEESTVSVQTDVEAIELQIGERKEIDFVVKHGLVSYDVIDESVARYVFEDGLFLVGVGVGETEFVFENLKNEVLKSIKITVSPAKEGDSIQDEQGGTGDNNDKDKDDVGKTDGDVDNPNDDNKSDMTEDNGSDKDGEGKTEDGNTPSSKDEDKSKDDVSGDQTDDGQNEGDSNDKTDDDKNDPTNSESDGEDKGNQGDSSDKEDPSQNENKPDASEQNYFDEFVRLYSNASIEGDVIYLNKTGITMLSFSYNGFNELSQLEGKVSYAKIIVDGIETQLNSQKPIILQKLDENYFLELGFIVSYVDESGERIAVEFVKVFTVCVQ